MIAVLTALGEYCISEGVFVHSKWVYLGYQVPGTISWNVYLDLGT